MTGRTETRDALVVVDMQPDFCPGGALPAPAGDAIVPAVNRHLADARTRHLPVYATRDWHPSDTMHFKARGGPWDPHCVQDTPGAAFHPAVQLPEDAIVISKGTDPASHGYSAFEGHTGDGRSLLSDLRRRHVDRILVAGIATEYCVRQTVLDALKEGIRAVVLVDAIAGIDQQPGDADRALRDMTDAGAELVER